MRIDDVTKLTRFHDRLNQKLWDGETLRKDVQYHLLMIAKEFIKFINVPDFELEDITISGSNCSYNYNDQSDIDLHLIVDGEGPCWKHLNELFLAKKNLFNDEHDITLKGSDVEVYVQDKNQPHISNGIYSIIRDTWIKKPQQITADPDKTNIQHKFNHLRHQIMLALQSNDPEVMSDVQTKIKNYRKSGLDENGEFGAENLAFKMIRNAGLLQALWDAKKKAEDKALSLAEGWEDKLNRTRDAAASDRGNLGAKGVIDPVNNRSLEPGEADQPDDPEHDLAEKIDPRITQSDFHAEKIIMIPDVGKLKLSAKNLSTRRPPQFLVNVTNEAGTDIGYFRFIVKDYDPDRRNIFGFRVKSKLDPHVIGGNISVWSEFQKKGIATAVYQFVKELGNDIKPSTTQTDAGKSMWRSFDRKSAVAESQTLNELNIVQTLKFIQQAHGDQLYGDLPYWKHPRAVAMTGKRIFGTSFSSDAAKVAFLHDVVEDTHVSLADLGSLDFSPEVIEAVGLLTKNRALTYAQNIEQIINSGNRLAMMVKYADNYENYSGDKSSWDPNRAASMEKKYRKSMSMLAAKLGVNTQQSESVEEAGGPDMSRRGFLGGLGALVASSGLPKVAAGALQQILGITTPQHLENMQYALKSRGTLLQLTNDELDKISSAIKGAPLDTWPGFRGTHKSVYGNPLIDQAYRKLTGEDMKAARVAKILKDNSIDPVKFFESPSVKAVIGKIRQELAAKWAQSGASDEPFKSPGEPPKLDKAAEPKQIAKTDMKQLAKPKYKGLADPDEEEELAIGRAGVTETKSVMKPLIKEPFKDPVAVLRKYLDRMSKPDWDKIDLLMKKIANRNGIDVNLLHKMWVDKYKKTPDAYCGIENKAKKR